VIDGELRLYRGFKALARGVFPLDTNDTDHHLWYHVAASFDSGAGIVRLFVNGRPVAEGQMDGREHDEISGLRFGQSTALAQLGVSQAAGTVTEASFERGAKYSPETFQKLSVLEQGGQEDDKEQAAAEAEEAVHPQLYLRWEVPQHERYVVQANDHFVYEVLWEGNQDLRIALDLAAADGKTLKDSGMVDQLGLLAHPATNLSEHASEKWFARIIRLPQAFVGQIIPHYYIACEKPGGGKADAIIRNVRFVAAGRGNPVRFTALSDIRRKK